jgi:hypothetical protein
MAGKADVKANRLSNRMGAAAVSCGIAACATLVVPACSADAALVGHWKLDETSGTTAVDATGGKDGTIGSNVNLGLPGISGNAFKFNGDSTQPGIVDMGNATSVFSPILASGGTQRFSISAWLNWTDNSQNRLTAISMARTAANSNTQYADIGITGSAPGFNTEGGIYGNMQNGNSTTVRSVINTTGRNNGGSLVDDNVIAEGTGTSLNDGQWHHTVMTLDAVAEVLTLYVDGVSVGTAGSATATITLPLYDNLEIGRLGRFTPVGGFNGLIDDVQIYDNALSAGDVSFLFSHPGSPIPEPASLAMFACGGLGLLNRRRLG